MYYFCFNSNRANFSESVAVDMSTAKIQAAQEENGREIFRAEVLPLCKILEKLTQLTKQQIVTQVVDETIHGNPLAGRLFIKLPNSATLIGNVTAIPAEEGLDVSEGHFNQIYFLIQKNPYTPLGLTNPFCLFFTEKPKISSKN